METWKHRSIQPLSTDLDELPESLEFDFGLSRRGFVQILGAGLLITVLPAQAQERRRGERGERRPQVVSARLHIGADGRIRVLTGKVEAGQGARAEITQAAAEELRVNAERIQLIMADTGLVPDDGITAGSRSTPSTLPAVRQACAAARTLMIQSASERWGVSAETTGTRDGKIVHAASGKEISYSELAGTDELAKAFEQAVSRESATTPIAEWKVLGTSIPRPNGRELVTGAHPFPSDISRPGMLHGKILRPPSYGAKLTSIDLAPAKEMKDVAVVQDGQFVGVAAPTTALADLALESIAKTAVWETADHPASKDVFDYLKQHAKDGEPGNPFADELATAAKSLRQDYHVAYAQHAPLEPRAAVAEWQDGKLTVWTGSQNPFGYRSELARALRVEGDQVRVIVPDFGGGFGGKHSGEAAVEAARLSRAAGRAVSLRWTRAEEFTWAYFRPAGVVSAEAGLDANGILTSWYFVNINSGASSVETPYRAGKAKSRFVQSEAPLRQGSYRALSATANTFARECFMDELAELAACEPLEFRLKHLENPRLRAVLESASHHFKWRERKAKKLANIGIGLACGTEKGSYVAACAEISVDRDAGRITVRHVCQVFECGAVVNPDNLQRQIQGAIIMGLGPALREEMQFEQGKMLNASFAKYLVPRFKDVPEIDIHVLDRPDLASTGAGETPIIAVAPAIANAVFHATGVRVREMPIRLAAL